MTTDYMAGLDARVAKGLANALPGQNAWWIRQQWNNATLMNLPSMQAYLAAHPEIVVPTSEVPYELPPGEGTATGPNTLYPGGQSAAQRAATMLYNAMRGLPFISPEFLTALQAGQAPAPRTVTPQTLAALSADSTLSDAFFSVIKANALYPTSYLAEIGRYIPRGREATPSFI